MPSTTPRPRRTTDGPWLAAHYEQMEPWYVRADVAIARSRRLRGDGPDDGSCRWCGKFGAHADGCLNVPRSDDGDGRG